jgi:hypothetical protein
VIHYDQLGNGRSTHLRDRGASHMPHVEEKDACLAAVAAFIAEPDRPDD